MQYNRLNNPNALIDLIKALDKRVSNVETRGTGTIGFVGTDGVELSIGVQPDGQAAIVPFVGDTTPPPVATTPAAVAGPGFISVTWDGLFVDLAEKPRDFDNLNVIGHKVVGGSVVQSVPVGIIRNPLDACLVGTDIMPVGETWEFSFVSEDYNGNLSDFSLHSTLTTQKSFAADVLIDDALAGLQQDYINAQSAAASAQQAANDAQAAADAVAGDLTATDAAVAAAQLKADQAFNNAATAAAAAGTAQTTADSKNRAWYQSTAPAGTSHRVGDSWFDTANSYRLSTWNGTIWQTTQDSALAQVTADSKGRTYTQNTTPPVEARLPQNLWIDTSAGTGLYVTKYWNGSAWTALKDADAAAAQTTADAKGETIYSSTEPVAAKRLAQNTWVDTSGGLNINKRWDGSAWVVVVDSRIPSTAAAVTAVDSRVTAVSATADSKGITYTQNTVPPVSARLPQNIWIDTSLGLANSVTKYWDGSAWTAVSEKAATDAQSTANAKGEVIYSSTTPAAAKQLAQNLWIDTTGGINIAKRWDGSGWVVTSDTRIDSNAAAVTAVDSRVTAVSATAAAKGTVFTQSTVPPVSERLPQNLWVDTSLGANQTVTKYWNGSAWTPVIDKVATDASTVVATKTKTYFQSTQPGATGNTTGDLWFDTANGNKAYVWNGTAWTVAQDTSISKSLFGTFTTDIDAQSPNKWMFTKYDKVTAANTIPSYLDIVGVAGTSSLIADSANLVTNVGDQYIGQLRTVINVVSSKTIAITATHDDGAQIYVDGVSVYTKNVFTAGAQISFTVSAGWHVIDVLWAEQAGGDGFNAITPTIGSQVTSMYAPVSLSATTKAVADAQAAANTAMSAQSYSNNASFDDWTSTFPTGFATWTGTPVKETAIYRRAPYAMRFNVPDATSQHGVSFSSILAHAPNLEYFTVEVELYLVSGTLDGSGMILDWSGMTNNRALINFVSSISGAVTGKWYRLTQVLRRPTNATGTWTQMSGYLMGQWSGHGTGAAKNIIYDWFNIRPATTEEITAYGTPASITTVTNLANSKGEIIYSTTTPTVAQQLAQNLWIDTNAGVNIPKRWNGSSWLVVTDKTATDAAAAASAAQSTANTAVTNAATAQGKADSAFSIANGKNTAYYQATQPSGGTYITGDTWFDTANNYRLSTYTGSGWQTTQDAIAAKTQAIAAAATDAQTKADTAQAAAIAAAATDASTKVATKNATFYQTAMPTGGTYKVGDLWFDTDDGNKIYAYNGTTFVVAQDAAIAAAQGTANSALTSANGKNKIYYQTTMPTGGTYIAGDTWFDTDDGNKIYVHNGTTFTASQLGTNAISNLAITDAQIATGTITNAKIGNLDAAKITTGTLDANRIGANTITANKIFVGDFTNLAADGAFTDVNKLNWTGSGSVMVSAGQPNRLRVITAASGNNDQANLNFFQVEGGDQVYVDALVYGETTNVGGGSPNVHLAVTMHDGTTQWPSVSLSRAAVQGAWTPLQGTITLPANSKIAKVELAVTYSADAVGNTYYFREVSVRRKSTGTLIVDGAIQAGSLIVANGAIANAQIADLNADKLTAGTVSAARLNAEDIRAKVIAATDISAVDIIAQGTLTSASGVFGTMDASVINAGTIAAARIGANTIDASKLNVTMGGLNLVPNSSFEVDSDANGLADSWAVWTRGAGDAGRVFTNTLVAGHFPGSTYAQKVTNTTVTNTEQSSIQGTALFSIGASAKAMLSLYGRADSNQNYSISLRCEDDAGVYKGDANFTAAFTTTAQRFSSVVTTPAGTTRAKVTITGPTGPVNGSWFEVDGVKVELGDVVSAWSPMTQELLPGTILANMISATAIDGKTITGATVQTIATASRGIKLTSTELAGYNNSGVKNFSLASDGTLTLTGAINSGSTITGASITGSTVTGAGIATNATANRGIKLTDTGITTYDASGNMTFKVDGTTGLVEAPGLKANSISSTMISATAIDGKTITGATVQTETTASRGIKLTSTELAGYDGAGVKNFSLTSAGALTLIGAIKSGSTIEGATLAAAGGGIVTTATANRGVKLTDTGIKSWDSSGNLTFSVDAATGLIEAPGLKANSITSTMISATAIDGKTITGATITGGTIQTETTASRGVKLTSTELSGYDGSGTKNFSLTSAGALYLRGEIKSGSTIEGAKLTGTQGLETSTVANTGVKINNAGIKAYDAGNNLTFNLDATTGLIEVPGIRTNTLKGDAIQAQTIAANKLAVADFTNLATIDELNGITISSFGQTAIVSGWNAQSNDTNSFFMFTEKRGPVPFKLNDTVYFEFTAKATTATTADFTVWSYNAADSNQSSVKTVSIGSTSTSVTGELKLTSVIADATKFVLGLGSVANKGIQVKNVKVYKKNGGELIVDGAIKTNHMTSGTIDAGVITAGTLTSTQIKSKSILADDLVISSTDNLVVEADFGNLGTSWGLGASVTINATAGRGSLPAMRVTGTTTNQTSLNLSNKFTVDSDARFRGNLWVKSTAALAADKVQLLFRPYVNGVAQTDIVIATNVALVANTWTLVSGMSPVLAAGTNYGEILVSVTNDNTATLTDIDYVSLTRAMNANLVVDGSITAASIAAGSIQAQHLTANSVTASAINTSALWSDSSWLGTAGASSLRLTSSSAQVTALDPDGQLVKNQTYSEVNAQGLRVYNLNTTSNAVSGDIVEVQDIIQLGTFDQDFFAINNAGVPQITMNSDGEIAAQKITVGTSDNTGQLLVNGIDLGYEVLKRPSGMLAWGQVPVGTNMSVNGGEIGLFEIAFDGGNIPQRMAEFSVNPFLIESGGAGTIGLRLRYTTDNTQPTLNSTLLGYNYNRVDVAGLTSTGDFTRLIGSNNGEYIRVLLCLYASGTWAKVYSGTGQSHIYSRVLDLGETIDPTAVANTAGGTPYTGSPSVPPTAPKVTKTVEWGFTGVRSYTGSNATYAYNTGKGYQGLSPAGYGNLKSMYLFPNTITSTISGSTINGIWLYGYFEHWYNGSGGTARFRLHSNTSLPSTYNGSSNGMNSGAWPRGAGRWVAVPSSLWAGFLAGTWKGFGFEGDSTYNTYGIANNARIKITYTK